MINTITFQTDPITGYAGAGPMARLGQALTRIRFQLGIGILLTVIAPIAARSLFDITNTPSHFQNSMIGTLGGLLFGYLVFRKVSALPGPGAIMRVIPAFSLSYAMIAIFFFALRLDYSRYQFLMSYMLSVGWFILVLVILQRSRRPRMALLKGGFADKLLNFKSVSWHIIETPEDAERAKSLPLVVDFKNPDLSEEWQRSVAEAAISGRNVFNAKQLAEAITGRVQLESLSENTFGHLSPDSVYAPMKRYVDVIAALACLVFLAPLLIVTAAAIKLTSPGPVIFKQERMGYRGIPFTLWKFRSMRQIDPSEVNLQSDMTQTDDDRITSVGHFIRNVRIDELPQIFNILRGDMSWIGPRPETMRLSKWYEGEIPFYRYRHVVRPGITGWAQVEQGHITSVDDARTKLEYDLFYVRRFSLWLDILIAMKTIGVILTARGAK